MPPTHPSSISEAPSTVEFMNACAIHISVTVLPTSINTRKKKDEGEHPQCATPLLQFVGVTANIAVVSPTKGKRTLHLRPPEVDGNHLSEIADACATPTAALMLGWRVQEKQERRPGRRSR